MSALLLKVGFLGISALLGAAAGWWIRGTGAAKQTPPPTEPELSKLPEEQVPEVVEEEADYDQVEAMMAQLQQLTTTVAADVGEHSTVVQEINDELNAGGATEASILVIVEKLVEANDAMQTQLAQAEERLQEQAAEIETHVKEARTDALTKLWNRRHFDDEMDKCKAAFDKSGQPSCVMMFDVDHFKKFNDTYGHQAGDEVLRGVARTLRKSVTNKQVVCRYGGEEFAIIFPGLDLRRAIPIGEKARVAIAAQVFEFEDLDLKVTASGGLSGIRANETVEEVVKRADDALYVCKEAGRNCGHWHDGTDSHPMSELPAEKQAVQSDGPTLEERIGGVSNRESFVTDIDRRIAEYKRGGAELSVLLVEVDKYSTITESYGERSAEVVLRAAAQFLRAAMRQMDHVALYDHATFGLLLPGAKLDETAAVAERLRTAIARCTLPMKGEKLTFTVSLGAAEALQDDQSSELLGRAQASLDTANESGGNSSFATSVDGKVESMALSV